MEHSGTSESSAVPEVKTKNEYKKGLSFRETKKEKISTKYQTTLQLVFLKKKKRTKKRRNRRWTTLKSREPKKKTKQKKIDESANERREGARNKK